MASLEDLPLLPPPQGQSSNFDNPETRGPAIVAVCSVFLSLMWPIFLLRLYSKLRIVRAPGWDDVSATLAAVGATAYAAISIWDMKTLGPHGWDVRAVSLTGHVFQLIALTAFLYGPIIYLAKQALFLLYFRLFSTNRWTRIAIYLGIVVNCLFYTASTIYYLVLCVPRHDESWIIISTSARCAAAIKMQYIQGVFSLISDIYIFVLPLPVLWRLQMPLKKKLGVTGIFLTGLIAILASALSLYYRFVDYVNPDISWNEPAADGLSFIEITIGVICSSVPQLPSLFRHLAPKLSRIARGPILNRINGPQKGPNVPRPRQREPNPEMPMTRRNQIETRILGSIQGDGNFIKSGRSSRIWDTISSKERLGPAIQNDNVATTRHNYYEMAEAPDLMTALPVFDDEHLAANNSDQPSRTLRQGTELSIERDGIRPSRKGYWDIMSIFRSGNQKSSAQSKSSYDELSHL